MDDEIATLSRQADDPEAAERLLAVLARSGTAAGALGVVPTLKVVKSVVERRGLLPLSWRQLRALLHYSVRHDVVSSSWASWGWMRGARQHGRPACFLFAARVGAAMRLHVDLDAVSLAQPSRLRWMGDAWAANCLHEHAVASDDVYESYVSENPDSDCWCGWSREDGKPEKIGYMFAAVRNLLDDDSAGFAYSLADVRSALMNWPHGW